ncbi:transposase [Jeotgalibacillus malaysiensis]|uniref:Transposase n=1 Tax=Jeotgalibacillus malaysiensis TaxID=1508404 RepID=A0A0B5AWM7_9BACL|nr:helix-turn-helix domain-containing protein [Jeotgalibacillus malaysiensis]AJD89766.1 transposase [Jeotgalibacillus malaysiensis]AJD89980.1 transposase [Jeotgalibacillus malaysiensis]AJD91909.1 transposase [Jeotgalibacillus malaysiensis]AJD92399.1 transposase [Jeotgalibacillus malaysiensis]AJD92550.1 transposase [Jeotgalibacillus malaysiensis]
MVKYNEKFKLMIVKEYLNGPHGIRILARKHGIQSKTQIFNWVNIYRHFGEEGLKKKKKAFYSVQFKLDVISFMDRTGASQTETALQFRLTNPSLIGEWKKKFLEGGYEALENPRGQSTMSDKKKNGQNETASNQNEASNREKELERENELLRLEVAYLKKLKAFQKDPNNYLEKHKQRYRSNSKKHSD